MSEHGLLSLDFVSFLISFFPRWLLVAKRHGVRHHVLFSPSFFLCSVMLVGPGECRKQNNVLYHAMMDRYV